MLDKPVTSATAQIMGWAAHSVKTGIEAKFGSERSIDKFVVFGVNSQQSLDVCFWVLIISDEFDEINDYLTITSGFPVSVTAPGAGKIFLTAANPAFFTCCSNLFLKSSNPFGTRDRSPYILARSVDQLHSPE
jgi:hypothetical protein